ncbi:MAG: hypothetical protein ACI9OJ_003968 [Myxococcota bacterium]
MTAALMMGLALTTAACGGGDDGSDEADDDASASGGTTGTDGTAGNPDPKKAPILETVEAWQAGAAGRTLVITSVGTDINRDTIRALVKVTDKNDAPVLAFFESLASQPDTNETFMAFPSGVRGRPAFTGTLTFNKLLERYPEIANVAVTLEDAAGNRSNEMSAAVAKQVVKSAGEECDVEYITSRCPPGMACKNEGEGEDEGEDAAICAEGDAPQVVDFAYYADGEPPTIVIIGTEPEEDIQSLHIEFFDEDGNSVAVALNSEESEIFLDYSRDEIEQRGYVGDGIWAVRLEPSGDFTLAVAEIAVTAEDAAGHVGERSVAKARKPKTAGNGSACDPWGYVDCWEKSSCVPGIPGETNKCESHVSMKKDLCKDAPLLQLVDGQIEVGGIAAGASAYEPPALCIADQVSRRPESVFRLVLDEPVANLRVSTDLAGTNFDTIVYIAPDCGEIIENSLACGDDTTQPDGKIHGAGSFEVSDVKAGEYVIVVDSWVEHGGAFTLRIEAN